MSEFQIILLISIFALGFINRFVHKKYFRKEIVYGRKVDVYNGDAPLALAISRINTYLGLLLGVILVVDLLWDFFSIMANKDRGV